MKNLNPGALDTVTFLKNGVATTENHVVTGAGEILLGSLVSGSYSNIIVHYGYCTSLVQPTETLIDSPFHFNHITTSNATKCGYCDGLAVLSGLHPGQIDSVAYTYTSLLTGITTPDTIAYYVNTDSAIVLSGLCKGNYNNFTIWTQTSRACLATTTYVGSITSPPIGVSFDTAAIHEGCNADTVLLNNSSFPAADLHYSWFFGDGVTSDVLNPVHAYTNTAGTNYTIKLYATNGFCLDSAYFNVAFTNYVTGGFTMNPTSYLCQQLDTLKLTNLSTSSTPAYAWSFGDGTTSTVFEPTHIYTNAGTYTVSLTTSNEVHCSVTTNKTITVDSTGPAGITATADILCNGQSVTINGIFARGGDTGTVWSVSDGFNLSNVYSFAHAFTSAGLVTVDLTANFRACPSKSASRTFTIFDYPTVYLGPDLSICPGSNPIVLTDAHSAEHGSTGYVWSTGETTPAITVTKPGEYILTVNNNGCPTSDTVNIAKDCYMDLPNVFTPNGDGVNDYFFPRKFLTKGVVTFKMSLFNRWGQLIYETATTDGQGWDGALNGTQQPEGVYIYNIDATYKDGVIEHHTGNITLLR